MYPPRSLDTQGALLPPQPRHTGQERLKGDRTAEIDPSSPTVSPPATPVNLPTSNNGQGPRSVLGRLSESHSSTATSRAASSSVIISATPTQKNTFARPLKRVRGVSDTDTESDNNAISGHRFLAQNPPPPPGSVPAPPLLPAQRPHLPRRPSPAPLRAPVPLPLP